MTQSLPSLDIFHHKLKALGGQFIQSPHNEVLHLIIRPDPSFLGQVNGPQYQTSCHGLPCSIIVPLGNCGYHSHKQSGGWEEGRGGLVWFGDIQPKKVYPKMISHLVRFTVGREQISLVFEKSLNYSSQRLPPFIWIMTSIPHFLYGMGKCFPRYHQTIAFSSKSKTIHKPPLADYCHDQLLSSCVV